MANSQAICTSFKVQLLTGTHAFGAAPIRNSTAADVFNAALYLTTGSLGAATTQYSPSNEVTGTGYTAQGVTVTNSNAPTSTGTTAYWTPGANFAWTTVTIGPFNAVLLFNNTQPGQPAVAVFVFGSQTVVSGNFTLTMPTNAAGTALLQLN